jgi:hypothetical protein
VYVRYQDGAGNVSGKYGDTVVLDTTGPSGSVEVAGGADVVNERTVQLTLGAEDAGSGVAWMQFSEDGKSWSGWEAYGTTKRWTLSEGDGTKAVYVRYQDGAGNVSTEYEDTVVLEGYPPYGTISLAGGEAYVKEAEVKVTLAIMDPGSGVARMRFSHDGIAWTAWERYVTSKVLTLRGGDGEKIVRAQFEDNAGHVSETITDTVILDTQAPESAVAPLASVQVGSDFEVTWGGTDGEGAGIASYDVEYKVGNEGAWQPWQIRTSRTTARFAGVPEQTYYFRSRARDRLEQLEAWPSGSGYDAVTRTGASVYLPLVSRQ